MDSASLYPERLKMIWEILIKEGGLSAEQLENINNLDNINHMLPSKDVPSARDPSVLLPSRRCECVSVIAKFIPTSRFSSGSIYTLTLTFKNNALHSIHRSHGVLSILCHLSISPVSKHSLHTCISSWHGQEPTDSSRNGMGFCCRSILFPANTV